MKHQRGLVVRGMSYEVNKLNEYCIYCIYYYELAKQSCVSLQFTINHRRTLDVTCVMSQYLLFMWTWSDDGMYSNRVKCRCVEFQFCLGMDVMN